MAHFAKLDAEGNVLDVHVVNNADIGELPFPDSEPVGVAFLTAWSHGYPHWKQTSRNNNFRGHLAGFGDKYDSEHDLFVRPQPTDYPSFILDTVTGHWVPPIEYPNDGQRYAWNEQQVRWDCVADDTLPL
jgi:hypothetical protein